MKKEKITKTRNLLNKLVIISVLMILCTIVILTKYVQNQEIKLEITNLCEKVKNELLEEYPVDLEDTRMMEIDMVSFTIDKIKKDDMKNYAITCTWNINIVDGYSSLEWQSKNVYSKIERGLSNEELSEGSTTSWRDNNITLVVNGNIYTPNNSDNVKDEEKKHVCAICGKEALFAESVINSKSNDWYCQKHWQDVKKYYGY